MVLFLVFPLFSTGFLSHSCSKITPNLRFSVLQWARHVFADGEDSCSSPVSINASILFVHPGIFCFYSYSSTSVKIGEIQKNTMSCTFFSYLQVNLFLITAKISFVFTRGFVLSKNKHKNCIKPVLQSQSVSPAENAFRNGITILTKYFFSLMKS